METPPSSPRPWNRMEREEKEEHLWSACNEPGTMNREKIHLSLPLQITKRKRQCAVTRSADHACVAAQSRSVIAAELSSHGAQSGHPSYQPASHGTGLVPRGHRATAVPGAASNSHHLFTPGTCMSDAWGKTTRWSVKHKLSVLDKREDSQHIQKCQARCSRWNSLLSLLFTLHSPYQKLLKMGLCLGIVTLELSS